MYKPLRSPSADSKEKHKADKKRWAETHLDSVRLSRKLWRDKNAEKIKTSRREWNQRNPERCRQFRHSYRAKLLKTKGFFTVSKWNSRASYYGGRCRYCKIVLQQPTIDHFIPLSLGGTNWPSNLVPACASCNSRKGAKTGWEFVRLMNDAQSLNTDPIRRASDSRLYR